MDLKIMKTTMNSAPSDAALTSPEGLQAFILEICQECEAAPAPVRDCDLYILVYLRKWDGPEYSSCVFERGGG